MHKLRTYLIYCLISLLFIVGQFIWHINLPYTLSGFRVQTDVENHKFIVTDCLPAGPAYKAGMRTGDVIIRINDINIYDFTMEHMGSLEDSYPTYSKLYQFDTPYEMECGNGFVCRFTITNDVSFIDRLRCLSFNNWITFLTGLCLVLFGIVSSFFAKNIEGTSDFIWFMLAMGPCISNGYSYAANPLPYTVFNFITFGVATSLMLFAMFRSVAYFFMLSGRKKTYSVLRKISFVPLFISVIKIVLLATGAVSVFNLVIVYLPLAGIGLSFLFEFVTFIILMRKLKQQSSVLLRFFFLGLCFSTIVPAIMLGMRVINNSYQVKAEYEMLYTLIPLLFIPFSVFCALFQTSSVNFDTLSAKFMNAGCTGIMIAALTFFFKGSVPEMIMLSFLMAFIYIVFEKPVVSFLFPKIEYVRNKLDKLERDVYKCEDTDEILAAASDWLFSMINMGSIAFCMFSDDKAVIGNVIYRKALDTELADAMLKEMVKEREIRRNEDEKLIIHKRNGFSVPFYRSNELAGFIFIGQKSRYSIFSNTEIRLVPPVARIIMESSMVIEINRQTRYMLEQNRYVSQMQNQIVYSFADMIESRDGLTGQHVKRTSQIVVLIINRLRALNLYSHELESVDYDMIAMAAPLHDIGKIKIPDAILSKPGKLTTEEFDLIKTHTVEGEKIISRTMARIEDAKYLKFAKDMALYHHEKWNGTGYPYGLSGEEIPLCARIMAVADVFDALCSARTYKEAYSIDRAFEIFEESKGTHFEPRLVELLYDIRPDLELIYAAG